MRRFNFAAFVVAAEGWLLGAAALGGAVFFAAGAAVFLAGIFFGGIFCQ
jgi:hypothetical protein